jgi:CDP-4-dehydro-6-deoxyglucose reductase
LNYRVKTTSGKEFEIKPSETILEASIKAGVNLPYGCRSGSCGSCKAKVLEGSVVHDEIMPGVITQEEELDGYHLFCRAFAMSDIKIDDQPAKFDQGILPKITPVRVESLKKLNHDVMQMILKLPAEEKLRFKAGQYIEFILNDGSRRAFSMANSPHEDLVELHIRLIEGGQFTNFVFAEMQEKSIHRIEGPLGQFYLRESERPIIFIAGGTGFAPIKSIINDMLFNQNKREIILYRGVRKKIDLYQEVVVNNWLKSDLNIKVHNVFSDEEDSEIKNQLVHEAVLENTSQINEYEVYCCGAPAMVEVAHESFVNNGLLNSRFYSDAFTFSPKKNN